jgi:UDP-N-acetylmuramate dehydrogenase
MTPVLVHAAARLRDRLRGTVQADLPLARYSSFRIGGPALLFAEPADPDDLRAALAFARAEGLPVHVLGGGSNTLFRDGGFPGLVVHLAGFGRLAREDDTIVAGAGVRVSRLLAFCCRQGLAGLELLSGVPGMVGGAVWGNAGAWGGATADPLVWADVLTGTDPIQRLPRAAIPFRYRSAGLPAGAVVLEAGFLLTPDDPGKIRRRISGFLVRRNASQPLEFRSAGSIFKNPPGDFAGRLVEAAGLRGTRIGQAMISERHGNFIVNLGGAAARDVLALADLARERVRARTGIDLELEIRVVGEG